MLSSSSVIQIFCYTIVMTSTCLCSEQNEEKFRFCAIQGTRNQKRTLRYCSDLNNSADSRVQCVFGKDRLDCLRKISKNRADFAVLTSEDLITASNSALEVLITNELRFSEAKHEYEIVAIFDKSTGIETRHDLKDQKFCHPGYGYESEWTTILSNYLEASVVPQNCETELTLTENRIKSSSDYFRSACKAGPWVSNATLDSQLKIKYANLCAACDNPIKCSKSDKYWGRRGSLFCLTDGAGGISWARWDDVQIHFGLLPGGQEAPPDNYAMLCPDDTIRELNSSVSPCVWVVKPWAVVASERSKAQEIQAVISKLESGVKWQASLLNLMESYHLSVKSVVPVSSIEAYLYKAVGFLSANSFPGCHPPRTIRICTTSILENYKCGWLSSAMSSYGIEPGLDCLKADNKTHCMEAVSKNYADVVMIDPEYLHEAETKYSLKTLFYETVNDEFKYLTVAVTRKNSGVSQLKGSKACFPFYKGVSWISMEHFVNKTCSNIFDYFENICAPGFSQECRNYTGDEGALRCLSENKGNVAFISKNSLRNSPAGGDFQVLCGDENKGECFFSWTPIGQAMIRGNSSQLWIRDTLDVFHAIDENFGNNLKSFNGAFQLFGTFNGEKNLLFHDNTLRLNTVPNSKVSDEMPHFYGSIIEEKTQQCNLGSLTSNNRGLLVSILIISKFSW